MMQRIIQLEEEEMKKDDQDLNGLYCVRCQENVKH